MRKLALFAVLAVAIFQAPLPLIAHDGGGSPALVPVSDIPGETGTPGTGAAEAPAPPPPPPPPAPPAPVPESPPPLVPTEQVDSPPAPAPLPLTTESAPPLKPRAELAQEDPDLPDPNEQEPDDAPDPTPDGQQDDEPEEFEEEFDGNGDDTAPGAGGSPGGPRATVAAERLPETGVRLAALSLAALALLSWGTGLRLLVPSARRA